MDRIQRLQFSNCVVGDGKLYGFLDDGGLPIEIDLKTKVVSMIDVGQSSVFPFQIDALLYERQMIYILELSGRRLLQFDVEKKEFKTIYINYEGDSWGNFALLTKTQHFLYIFPKKADCIIRIDLQKETVTKEKINLCGSGDNGFSCAFRNKNKVCLFSKDGSGVWLYDLESRRFGQRKIGQEIGCIIAADVFDGNAYLLDEEGNVYICSLQDYFVEKIRKSASDDEPNMWRRLAVTEKNIWMLPALGDNICILDRDSMEEERYVEYPPDFSYIDIKGQSKYHGYGEDQEKYFFAQRLGNYMLVINKYSGQGEWIKLLNPMKREWYKVFLKNLGELQEGKLNALELRDFLNLI